MKRVAFSLAAVVALVTIGVGPAAAAPQSDAGTTLIICIGPETTHYDPGLTLVPRPTSIHAEADYVACVGGPTSATGQVDGVSPLASCLIISMPQVSEVVHFDNNQTSVINYTTSAATRAGGFNIVILTGTVTNGAHQGATAVKTVQLTPENLPLACLTQHGVQQATGLTQLEILG